MWLVPNYERLKKLKVEGLDPGDSILFCPNCDFQIVNAGMKPECPNCKHRLHVVEYEEPWLVEKTHNVWRITGGARAVNEDLQPEPVRLIRMVK